MADDPKLAECRMRWLQAALNVFAISVALDELHQRWVIQGCGADQSSVDDLEPKLKALAERRKTACESLSSIEDEADGKLGLRALGLPGDAEIATTVAVLVVSVLVPGLTYRCENMGALCSLVGGRDMVAALAVRQAIRSEKGCLVPFVAVNQLRPRSELTVKIRDNALVKMLALPPDLCPLPWFGKGWLARA